MDNAVLFKQLYVPTAAQLRDNTEAPQRNESEPGSRISIKAENEIYDDILLSGAKAQQAGVNLVTEASLNAIGSMNAMCAMIYMMCAEKIGNK